MSDIGDRRSNNAADVDAVVGVEKAILQRNGGVDQVRGNGGERHYRTDDAISVLDVEQYPVAVVDLRRLGQLLGIQRARVRQVAGIGLVLVDGLGAAAHAEQAEDGQADHDDLVEAAPLAAPGDPGNGEHADCGSTGKPVLLFGHRVYNG